MSYDQFKMTFIKKGTKIQFFNHLKNIVERVYKDEKIWPFQGNNIVRLSKIAIHTKKRTQYYNFLKSNSCIYVIFMSRRITNV